jgi:hypothetical protein
MLAFFASTPLPRSYQLLYNRAAPRFPERRPIAALDWAPAAVTAGPKQVLFLGGTGRVGSAAAESLGSLAKGPLDIFLGGRNAELGVSLAAKLNVAFSASSTTACPVTFRFIRVDTASDASLDAAFSSSELDLVVHTAGPFQKRDCPSDVLLAAIRARKDYVDVCDDATHALSCRAPSAQVEAAGIAAHICTGIYPGVSNLLAAACVNASPIQQRATSIKFSYYTAGTGGIGSTVLASTFLILSEKVVTFRDGKMVELPPASGVERVDFGGKIGTKSVYLLNLPEVSSVHDILLAPTGGGTVLAKLSTDPPMWNWLLRVTARLVPSSILRNRPAMQALSAFSLPVVQAVDKISGARTGIRVDVDFVDGSTSIAFYEHETLRGCVGDSTAAFSAEMLYGRGDSRSGVFYPEELEAVACMSILKNSATTANRCVVDYFPSPSP